MAEYKYKYPNESFSGCDMTASIVYDWIEEDSNGKKHKRYSSHILGELQTISYSIHMEKRPVRSIGNVNAKDYVMGPRTIAGSLVFAVFNRHFAKNIMNEHNDYFTEGQAFLVDELPPFNVVISLANEYGLRSKLVIYGVRLLNEGQVMSVNDVYTENTYQFMATDVEYMNTELTYQSRSNYGSFLKLIDADSKKDPNMYPSNNIGKAFVHYNDRENDDIEKITLSVLTTDATRNNPNGRAMFSLTPIQTEGTIDITDSNNDVISIGVTGANSYSIQLPPDMYSARFTKPNHSKWQCNSRTFDIKEFREPYDSKKYSPLIEVITDTTMQVYSNEPTHTHLLIRKYKSDTVKYHELKNRRVKLTGLDRNQEYEIATCNGPDTLTSPMIKVKTFKVFDRPFILLKQLIETNQSLLLYKDLQRYYTIIDRAKELAINSPNFQSTTDSIILLKQKYETELKNLNKDSVDYNDNYIELTHNIYACNELIYLSTKIQNNTITVVNKETPVEIPIMFYDEHYNNCFQFAEDVTKAETYRVYKGVTQSAHTIQASLFKTVEGRENSISYTGKSGVNHYIQALREHVRSPKLEFYCMTLKEKQEKINGDLGKDTITDQAANKINTVIKDELGENINNSMLTRAFMRKTKTIDDAILLDVDVVNKTDEYIEVNTVINKLFNSEEEYDYYLAVAKKQDIISNDFIYKKRFTNKEEVIRLDDVDFALLSGEDYALWIEDAEFNQVSNITTFNMSQEEQMNDRLILEYELKNIISEIKARLNPLLPSSVYESLLSHIEYNEEITKVNIIDETVNYLLYSGLGESTIINCLSAIKVFIGTIMESDDIINNMSYVDKILSYECSLDNIYSTIISVNKSEIKYNCVKSSSINLNDYEGDYVFIMALTPDLKYKSKIMFVNKLNNTMEVL